MSKPKPFAISKQTVMEAYRRVKANKGAAGVDGESIEEFEKDLKGNLYKLWNRMSSGTYFPPLVRMVEIPKPGGAGIRVLGVPTVADRIAQTVVKMYLEPEVEPIFHPDSYGYRPGRSALQAVGRCRERCWRNDWVIDLDIRAFFDTLPHSLVMRAVQKHTQLKWVLLYCNVGWKPRCNGRTAVTRHEIGEARKAQRSHPCWRTCSCTMRSIAGCVGNFPPSVSSDIATTRWFTA